MVELFELHDKTFAYHREYSDFDGRTYSKVYALA